MVLKRKRSAYGMAEKYIAKGRTSAITPRLPVIAYDSQAEKEWRGSQLASRDRDLQGRNILYRQNREIVEERIYFFFSDAPEPTLIPTQCAPVSALRLEEKGAQRTTHVILFVIYSIIPLFDRANTLPDM